MIVTFNFNKIFLFKQNITILIIQADKLNTKNSYYNYLKGINIISGYSKKFNLEIRIQLNLTRVSKKR